MLLPRALLTACLLLSLGVASAESTSDQEQCGVYLAISSTSTVDETAWGLYAGTDIPQHHEIPFPDVAVNMFHLKANAAFSETSTGDEDYLNRVVDYLETFIWVPEAAGARFEMMEGRTVTAIPGAGVLGGFNPRLTNANWNHSAAYFRPAWNEEKGVAHAGRGAYSNFFNVGLYSTSDIVAGAEIFLDYGENWENEDKEQELDKDDHDKIDETVNRMIQFFEKHKDDLDEDKALQVYSFLTKDVMTAAIGANKAKKVQALLPPRPSGLVEVQNAGGTLAYSQPTVFRKVEWLAEHGRCMDHIRPGPSQIPHAGRGAFASRPIPAGGLVAPVPLIQIPDKSIFDMHDVTPTGDGEYVRLSDKVIGQQLMVNYCYGHPQSSLLLVPSGAVAALINHDDNPNAKLVWSNHVNHNKLWLQTDPYELIDDEHAYIGLMLEIVALRDIAEGEEVTIDYGPEWKEAWKRHETQWKERVASGDVPKEWPIRAIEMNEEYKSKVYKTPQELEADPYPENVELTCFLMIKGSEQQTGTIDNPKLWMDPEKGTVFESENVFAITILQRQDADELSDTLYTVSWVNNKGAEIVVANVPHRAMVFVDKPMSGDQFTKDAFRHFIGIPDEIFPANWRNLK